MPDTAASRSARPTRDFGGPLVVFDIDGVLADVRHRLHHLDANPKDWESFFAAADNDPVLTEGLAAVRAESAEAGEIVYLSGRPERLRRLTTRWLSAAGFPDARLFLRPDRDRRPARVFKPGLLDRLGGPAAVKVIYDDDDAVVAALREQGYQVVHVLWGKPTARALETLTDAQEDSGRT